MIVPAGRINKLFGTEGGVMLSLYPAFPEDFTTDTPLRVTMTRWRFRSGASVSNAAASREPRRHSPISTPSAGRRSLSGWNSGSR